MSLLFRVIFPSFLGELKSKNHGYIGMSLFSSLNYTVGKLNDTFYVMNCTDILYSIMTKTQNTNVNVNCPLVLTVHTMAGVGILLVISCRETVWVATMTVLEVLSPPVENMTARLSLMGFIISCHLY